MQLHVSALSENITFKNKHQPNKCENENSRYYKTVFVHPSKMNLLLAKSISCFLDALNEQKNNKGYEFASSVEPLLVSERDTI